MLAAKSGIEPLRLSFTLRRVEALVGLNKGLVPSDLPLREERTDWPAESTAHFHLALGQALLNAGSVDRGAAALRRAGRIFAHVANPLREQQLQSVRERFPSATPPAADTAAHLDSAVVLLDLAGYPHILAREAYAILQESGSVVAVALVAIGKNGTRAIEVEGWTERQAVEAAGAPDVEKMAAGTHRDEVWQVLARPRDGLEHHCTVVAVRKLVAAAAALDRYRRDEKQRAALWPAEALENDPDSVWASEQTAEILGIARRIAPTPLSVLLTGETGTGKEMLARAIHRASDRAEKPFLPFNCTAVPRDMLESQLFGYRRGAFTGADASFAGIIRSAAGGTLFLDEIAEVGPELQPKLLRFLEAHEIHPLGEPQPIKVDVRVIAATNRDMEQLVADGRFREDLFYRLNVIRLKLPPLRERREEIPPLVQHYLRRYSDEQKKGTLRLADDTLEYLLLYSWPGNVRQLANEVRRMVALAERDATLSPAELSPEIQASRKTIAVPAGDEPEIRVRLEQPLPAAVELLEKTMVRHALTRANGRVEEASRLLGISRKGLFLKRKRWGLRHAS
jgi:DNA-binding NtrC family response regulator